MIAYGSRTGLEHYVGGRRRLPGRVITRSAPVKGDPKRKLYSGVYRVGDGERSAGTFETYEEAEAAWLGKADRVRRGTHIDPNKSRMLFRDFVEIYRMTHHIEQSLTAKNQDSVLRNHLLPTFGSLQLQEIDTLTVQAWMKSMATDGLAAATRRSHLGTLSGVMTAALHWGYIERHPCPGVKKPNEKASRDHALERAEFDKVHAVLPGPVSQLFVWVDVNSGLRIGELTELRVSDVHSVDEDLPEEEWPEEEMAYVHVRRSVQDVGPEYGDDGGRFKVSTTKNGEDRKVSLDPVSTRRLLDHIETHTLSGDDLVFPLYLFEEELVAVQDPATPMPADLGRTEPDARHRTYKHGTSTGYGPGKCRCQWCRRAMAEYRAGRRARGLDKKPLKASKRGMNTSGHLPRDTWRNMFWKPAVGASGIGRTARFHDLRHTHATWLARRGVDVIELQERMGHKRLSTTQIYISKNQKPRTGAAHLMSTIMAEPSRKRRLRRVSDPRAS
jgi:integrase